MIFNPFEGRSVRRRLDNYYFGDDESRHVVSINTPLQWYRKRSDGRWHAFFVHQIFQDLAQGANLPATIGGMDHYYVSYHSVCRNVIVTLAAEKWNGQASPQEPICPRCQKAVLFRAMAG